MSDLACAKCGHPRREHSYNGACYGLCAEFVSPPPEMPDGVRDMLRSKLKEATGYEWPKLVNEILAALRSMPPQGVAITQDKRADD